MTDANKYYTYTRHMLKTLNVITNVYFFCFMRLAPLVQDAIIKNDYGTLILQ